MSDRERQEWVVGGGAGGSGLAVVGGGGGGRGIRRCLDGEAPDAIMASSDYPDGVMVRLVRPGERVDLG